MLELFDKHHPHPLLARILPAVGPVLGATDTNLDRSARVEQTLVARKPERRTVVKLLAPKRSPRVGVCIDVDHADGPVNGRERSEDWISDRVVTTCRQRQSSRSDDTPHEGFNVVVDCSVVVDLTEPNIADVCDPGEFERIHASGMVDRTHQARLVADLARTVPGTGTVRYTAVVRHPVERNVDIGQVWAIRRPHERRDLLVARLVHRVIPRINSLSHQFSSSGRSAANRR